MEAEEFPKGATQGIVRIGNTVRRPRHEWSEAVEALLLYLEDMDFPFSPRFQGIDEEGRQILTYIEGEAGNYPAPSFAWSDETLARMAAMLRQLHDAMQSFPWSRYSNWQFSCPSDLIPEVLCHNDFSTYNCVYFDATPIAVIDFDTCGPGTRAWDLAYTAFRCIPVTSPEQQKLWGLLNPVNFQHRLGVLLDSYGYDDSVGIIDLIYRRILEIRHRTADQAIGNDYNARRIRDERHLESYDESLKYFVKETDYGVPNN